MRPLIPLIAAFALASPASAFTAQNSMRVQQTGPQDFQVAYRTVQVETAYWCAAGDFVTRALGLPNSTRIYRASPDPREQGRGIAFTLDPARSSGDSGISNFSGGGNASVSAGHAVGSYCSLYDIFPFD